MSKNEVKIDLLSALTSQLSEQDHTKGLFGKVAVSVVVNC